jgi:hypothetical protein
VDFKQRLADCQPRDRSGSRSSDRFAYQQDWALCHILDLHNSGVDYVLTFDHHEDVTEVDSETDPSLIRGFQIKTKSAGNWTTAALTKQEKGSGDSPKLLPSIIGKLYTLKRQFPDETRLLQFVSNAYVTVKLKATGKKCKDSVLTKFEDLSPDNQSEIRDRLKSELEMTEAPELSSLLELALSDIPLKEHDTHTKGRLVNFLQTKYPHRTFNITVIYRSLISEVAVRNNNQDEIRTFENLVRLKSISRRRYEELLVLAGVSRTEITWSSVESRLNSEGAPLSLLQAMAREWEGALLDRVANRDVVRLRLSEIIRGSCRKHAAIPRLTDLVNTVYEEILPQVDPRWDFSEIYLKACIVVTSYEPE